MTATYATACTVARDRSLVRQSTWAVIGDADPAFLAATGQYLGYNVREIGSEDEFFSTRIHAAFHNGRKIK